MADTKPTVASLAAKLDETGDLAAAALDGVERLNKDLMDAKEGLPQHRLDHVLGRLEALEKSSAGVTYDWSAVIEGLKNGQQTLLDKINDALTRVARAEEVTAPQSGGVLDEAFGAISEIQQQHALFQKNVYERLDVIERGALGYSAPVPGLPGVGRKVAELMKAVAFIGKNRKAEIEGRRGDDFSYMFRGIDDAQDAVGTAMRDVGLIMSTKVVKNEYHLTPVERKYANGGAQTQLYSTCVMTMRYTFVDPEDMSEFSFEMVGEGKDASDKAASKAASMACKYALFQALMIPVKGQEESDGHNPEIVSETEPPAASVSTAPAQSAPPAQSDQQARVTRATAAVQAIKVLHTLPNAQDALARLNSISERVKQERLGEVEVEGLPVKDWANSQWKVLQGLLSLANKPTDQGAQRADVDPGHQQAAQQQRSPEPPPAQEPPADDPWGSYTQPAGSEW